MQSCMNKVWLRLRGYNCDEEALRGKTMYAKCDLYDDPHRVFCKSWRVNYLCSFKVVRHKYPSDQNTFLIGDQNSLHFGNTLSKEVPYNHVIINLICDIEILTSRILETKTILNIVSALLMKSILGAQEAKSMFIESHVIQWLSKRRSISVILFRCSFNSHSSTYSSSI